MVYSLYKTLLDDRLSGVVGLLCFQLIKWGEFTSYIKLSYFRWRSGILTWSRKNMAADPCCPRTSKPDCLQLTRTVTKLYVVAFDVDKNNLQVTLYLILMPPEFRFNNSISCVFFNDFIQKVQLPAEYIDYTWQLYLFEARWYWYSARNTNSLQLLKGVISEICDRIDLCRHFRRAGEI